MGGDLQVRQVHPSKEPDPVHQTEGTFAARREHQRQSIWLLSFTTHCHFCKRIEMLFVFPD